MARHVFYSLHYDGDRARAELVRNIPGLVAHLEAKQAEWDVIKRSGDFALKRWFEQQIKGRSCLIVLIGAQTASRPLVQYEIARWSKLKLGMLGVHIHQLKDAKGKPGVKGANPFEQAASGLGALAAQIPVYEAPETDSKLAYRYIADNLAKWVESAVAKRPVYP
ncbi:MAG: hypothetical protein RLZZ450_4552 [Pseudomonadota bacterium]|jgi:hypothetical protein